MSLPQKKISTKKLSIKFLHPTSKKSVNILGKDKHSAKNKFIKLRIHGVEKKVNYDEYLSVKNLDLAKLDSIKDSLIQIIKGKKEFYKNQDCIYDMKLLKNIAERREKEFRESIVKLHNNIRNRIKTTDSDNIEFFKSILEQTKNIYQQVDDEIETRKIEILNKIIINIDDCAHKQNNILDKKIKEQNDMYEYFQMSTNEMKDMINNYLSITNRIKEYKSSIYDYGKKIVKEKIKYEYITTLMKECKLNISKITEKINEYKKENDNPLNKSINDKKKHIKYRTLDIESSRIKDIFQSKKNNNFVLPSFISTTTNDNNNLNTINSNKNNNNLNGISITYSNNCTVNDTINNIRNLSRKLLNSSNSTDYYSRNKKNQKHNLFRLKNYKYDHTNIFSILNNNLEETEPNLLEKNIIYTTNKEIKAYKENTKNLLKLMDKNIPDNNLYLAIKAIINYLKNDNTNQGMSGIKTEFITENMKTIPIQNKLFRNKFIKLVFEDKNIHQFIVNKQYDVKEKIFNKNFFGAVKKNKSNIFYYDKTFYN